jgi:hypothetical protein
MAGPKHPRLLEQRESGMTVFCLCDDQWHVEPLGKWKFGAWWFGGRFGGDGVNGLCYW